MKKRYIVAVLALCVLFLIGSRGAHAGVNFCHLDALCQDIVFAGKPCTIVHIYADAPDYQWTDAAKEGITCVDDVARAAVVTMQAFEAGVYCDMERIRGLLNFVLAMQADDGEFYNFIHSDLSINKTGDTSRKDFAFWAARGYWALGSGAAFFRDKNPAYADTLKQAFLKCRIPLDKLMQRYGQFVEINGRPYPDWLMIRHAGDATSELLLGLAAYLQVEDDPLLADYADKLSEGLIAMHIQDHPVMAGAFKSWPGIWHAWGNSQVQALAALAEIVPDSAVIKSALASADHFLSRLAGGQLITSYDFSGDAATSYPQIAYDVRTTALGLLAVYQLTAEPRYARLAGLAASWLFGNNVADEPMYDPATGRVYDGIDPKGVNRNSGAESTIEGLLTLLGIESEPLAASWLHARPVGEVHSLFTSDGDETNQFENKSGRVTIICNRQTQTVDVK